MIGLEILNSLAHSPSTPLFIELGPTRPFHHRPLGRIHQAVTKLLFGHGTD